MVYHLLPIKHFHIIFTIPKELRDWFYYNQKSCYGLLFRVAWQTVQSLAGEGATGMVATLHTWGSNLSYHPHIHCIVPSGSFTNNRWVYSRGKSTTNFYCDAKELRQRYKDLFIQHFLKLVEYAEQTTPFTWKGTSVEKEEVLFRKLQRDIKQAVRKEWTVRIENPVLGVEQIVEYLARYVRRVALTNSRILDISATKVTLSYKQYHLQKKGNPAPIGEVHFEGAAFIDRYAQHIPPIGFHKVRYYGCYAYGQKKLRSRIYTSISQQPQSTYQLPSTQQLLIKLLGQDPAVCTGCGSIGTIVTSPLVRDSSKGYYLTRSYRMEPIRAGPTKKCSKKC